MTVTLIQASAQQEPILQNLMQFYTHDFSEFWAGTSRGDLTADGQFEAYPLADYWTRPAWSAQLIWRDGVLAGFAQSKGDAVIYMDTDLQDPPELIPRMLQKWREGADVVHTTRTARKGENAFKMWLTRQAYRAINGLSDITILQNTGDFKLISRRALNEILKLSEFDPFLRGLVAWVGFKQEQVFYERDARFAGATKYSLWRSLNPYKEFLRGITTFSTLPLYFALFLGILVSALSFVLFAVMVLTALVASPSSDLFWPRIQPGISLLLGGIILLTVGILGIYVGRIHRESIDRPRYIIAEFIGGE